MTSWYQADMRRWLLVATFALLAELSAVDAACADPAALELDGTWYVLVHYRDESSGRADVDRWLDHIWVFKTEASRLKWIEYPRVMFKDERQRFRVKASGRRLRVETSWLPTPKQHLEIRKGLQVSMLGQRTKILRGNAEQGFRSTGVMRAESASVIGFSETWEVRDLHQLPLFVRSDTMGSIRTERLEGATRYQVRAISDGGRRLEGDFDRDGALRGTFQMIRAGDVIIIGEDGEPVNEPR